MEVGALVRESISKLCALNEHMPNQITSHVVCTYFGSTLIVCVLMGDPL